MNREEWIRLSELEGVTAHNSTLGTVQTEYYVLSFEGRKKDMQQQLLRQLPKGNFVYWKSRRQWGKNTQLVLIEDKKTATIAKLFADDQEIRSLTVGELSTARNEIDIPWLPSARGFLEIQEFNSTVQDALAGLNGVRWELRGTAFADVRDQLDELMRDLKSRQKAR